MAQIQFTTQDYPKADRLEVVRDVYAPVAQVELGVPRREIPDITIRMCLLPGVTVALAECSTLKVTRGQAQLADGNDNISLLLNPGGPGGWESHQRHLRQLACPAGFGCVGFKDRPGLIDFHGRPGQRARFLSIDFPRALLGPRVADLDRVAKGLLVPGDALQLLMRQALALTRSPDVQASAAGPCEMEQLLDMATLALGGTPDATARAAKRGLSMARLRAIKADMAAYAGHGELSVKWVAKRYGISPGYVRALFDRQGTSFTDYLLELRLQRAYRQLSRLAPGERSIADVAYAAGFNNLSWFYRAFRQRFGMTPGDARYGVELQKE
ncbi:helix-turn-helix transcriptional regulator [Halomonas salipaludis]|uniref:AraC family transcriptional regulator n=1 Tax=Halomonas salipaludis TaxID=2032625 RepID=A0A2A2ERV4_9GAMM|nr:AraC family transcriptional regulator [Halomonas salipaludis]PAU76161.1 AraC family transcriptional regulator [Halomonas salipaludis]